VVKRLVATDKERRQLCQAALAGIAAESLDDVTGEIRPRKDRHFSVPGRRAHSTGRGCVALGGRDAGIAGRPQRFSDRFLAKDELRGNTARRKIAAAVHLVVAEHAGV